MNKNYNKNYHGYIHYIRVIVPKIKETLNGEKYIDVLLHGLRVLIWPIPYLKSLRRRFMAFTAAYN